MAVLGIGKETYFFVNGLKTLHPIQLREGVSLLPAHCSAGIEEIIQNIRGEVELGITTLLLNKTASQLKIIAKGPKELAIRAWNSQWDILLLNAIFCTEAIALLQSTSPAENFPDKVPLNVTACYIHLPHYTYHIKKKDIEWLSKYYSKAYSLLDNDAFSTAVHSLATYHWHSMPRVQLSILWAGIESLFDIHSEISFRLSLSIAKFLEPSNSAKNIVVYKKVKNLYNYRSKAVHGAPSQPSRETVLATIGLLNLLIKKCITTGALPPKTEKLLFNN